MGYDRRLVAERLGDLRRQSGKTLSYAKLSEGIFEKTGVYISGTQLQKYENTEKKTRAGDLKEITDIMNVENMIAIADYYGVSYEYLLGRSDSQKSEYHDAQQTTGLTDRAIHKLPSSQELIDRFDLNSARITTVLETKSPQELSDLIEHKDFRVLIDLIRALKTDNDGSDNKQINYNNPTLGPTKVNLLKEELGAKATQEYILFLIQNVFRGIVWEISNSSPIEDEARPATQADINDFLGGR